MYIREYDAGAMVQMITAIVTCAHNISIDLFLSLSRSLSLSLSLCRKLLLPTDLLHSSSKKCAHALKFSSCCIINNSISICRIT